MQEFCFKSQPVDSVDSADGSFIHCVMIRIYKSYKLYISDLKA